MVQFFIFTNIEIKLFEGFLWYFDCLNGLLYKVIIYISVKFGKILWNHSVYLEHWTKTAPWCILWLSFKMLLSYSQKHIFVHVTHKRPVLRFVTFVQGFAWLTRNYSMAIRSFKEHPRYLDWKWNLTDLVKLNNGPCYSFLYLMHKFKYNFKFCSSILPCVSVCATYQRINVQSTCLSCCQRQYMKAT